jgi:hypothetical protein
MGSALPSSGSPGARGGRGAWLGPLFQVISEGVDPLMVVSKYAWLLISKVVKKGRHPKLAMLLAQIKVNIL